MRRVASGQGAGGERFLGWGNQWDESGCFSPLAPRQPPSIPCSFFTAAGTVCIEQGGERGALFKYINNACSMHMKLPLNRTSVMLSGHASWDTGVCGDGAGDAGHQKCPSTLAQSPSSPFTPAPHFTHSLLPPTPRCMTNSLAHSMQCSQAAQSPRPPLGTWTPLFSPLPT